MHKELQDKLFKEFPNLFVNNRFDQFWVSDGWFNLIYDLSIEINNIINERSLDKELYYVVQTKSKFYSLRYYMNQSTPEMNELISMAENKSYNICTICGKDTENMKRKGMWSDVACETCTMIKNIIE